MLFATYLDGQLDRNSIIMRLGVSNRQFCRLQNKLLLQNNLQHKLCNRPSNHSINLNLKAKGFELYKTKYRGWNYEHIHDALLSRDKINVIPDTI